MVYRAWNCLKWGPVLHAFPTHCFGVNCTGNLLFCENPVYNGTGTATLWWALPVRGGLLLVARVAQVKICHNAYIKGIRIRSTLEV